MCVCRTWGGLAEVQVPSASDCRLLFCKYLIIPRGGTAATQCQQSAKLMDTRRPSATSLLNLLQTRWLGREGGEVVGGGWFHGAKNAHVASSHVQAAGRHVLITGAAAQTQQRRVMSSQFTQAV